MLDEDERLELLGGELIVAEPQGSPHYTAIQLVDEVLREVLGPGWLVRTHGPVALDDDSEPEPDVSVVRGRARDYSRQHPAKPALIVEVCASRSRLTFDREHKGSIYARAGIADYWVLNLISRVLEVYRSPVEDDSAAFGWCYASRELFDANASCSPLVAPQASIAVRDLLP